MTWAYTIVFLLLFELSTMRCTGPMAAHSMEHSIVAMGGTTGESSLGQQTKLPWNFTFWRIFLPILSNDIK